MIAIDGVLLAFEGVVITLAGLCWPAHKKSRTQYVTEAPN